MQKQKLEHVQPTMQKESDTLCPLRPFFQVGPCDLAGIRLGWEDDEVTGFKLVLAFPSPFGPAGCH